MDGPTLEATMKRCIFPVLFVLSIGCSSTNQTSEDTGGTSTDSEQDSNMEQSENTAALCRDNIDNDQDGDSDGTTIIVTK